MSLGAKSKPLPRDDGFKSAMADAQVQHTRSKPQQARMSEDLKPAHPPAEVSDPVRSDANEREASPVDDLPASSEPGSQSASKSVEADGQSSRDDNPVEDESTADVNPTEIQDGLQPDDLVPTSALLAPQFHPLTTPNHGGGDEFNLAVSIPMDGSPLTVLGGQKGGALLVSGATLDKAGINGNGLSATLDGADSLGITRMSLSSAPHAGQAALATQIPNVKETISGLVLMGAEDTELDVGLGLDRDSQGKTQVITGVSDKLLLSPSQKVLAATLMQTDTGMLKVDPSPDQKATALKASSEAISSISSAFSTSTNSLNSRIQPITVPVNQPHWAQSAGERVVWMVSQKLQSAEIQLDPPELGPLQVKVSVQHDQVSITFVSHSAHVRDALDQHALRLREMFEGQGLDLVDVDVSDQSFQQREEQGDSQPHSGELQDDVDSINETQMITTKLSSQLVDHFV